MRISLTKKASRRRPTWFGWLIIVALFFSVCAVFTLNLYSFLAKDVPPKEGILIIEGWIEDDALEEAVEIYNVGNYQKVAATGVQIEVGVYLVDWKSYSELTAARLVELGIPVNEIIVTRGIEAQRDRTYAAALALRNKLDADGNLQTKLHLLSVGPHARRSWLLFKKAFGPEYEIGVSSLEDKSYDSKRWWTSSNGFRAVIYEFIAYIYTVLFFHP